MTPQILELSGIGRPDVLQKAGIPVKLALEGVGENVQDHIICGIVFRTFRVQYVGDNLNSWDRIRRAEGRRSL